jgi:bifunctional ADP-heptose synthase (sugar kinase/adenylyltransferase)
MEEKRLLEAIEGFKGKKILVVGDIMLDVYEYYMTEHSKLIPSEKTDKRAYRSQDSEVVLGGAGNVAANLKSLGVDALQVGISGNDESYFKLRELCKRLGISHVIIRDAARPTTVINHPRN